MLLAGTDIEKEFGKGKDDDNFFEGQFERHVLPERDLSTEGSSDDNEQVAE